MWIFRIEGKKHDIAALLKKHIQGILSVFVRGSVRVQRGLVEGKDRYTSLNPLSTLSELLLKCLYRANEWYCNSKRNRDWLGIEFRIGFNVTPSPSAGGEISKGKIVGLCVKKWHSFVPSIRLKYKYKY